MNQHVNAAIAIQYLGSGPPRRELVTEVCGDLSIAINNHDTVTACFQRSNNRSADRTGAARNHGYALLYFTVRYCVHSLSVSFHPLSKAEDSK